MAQVESISDVRSRLGLLLAKLKLSPYEAQVAFSLAELGLDHGLEPEVIPPVADATRLIKTDFRLWQMLALLYRSAAETDMAIRAFEAAAALAPQDVRIAHGLALSTHEAGLSAVERYANARRLAPDDKSILVGSAAALVADRRTAEALDLLEKHLDIWPQWLEGHEAFIRLAVSAGCDDIAIRTINKAIAQLPSELPLYVLRLRAMSRLVQSGELLQEIDKARHHLGDHPVLRREEAIAASEAGQFARADAAFLALGRHANPSLALSMLRHLVRAHRFKEGEMLAAKLVSSEHAITAWAYRHTIWRITSDPRLDWLDRDGNFIREIDLSKAISQSGELVKQLRLLHEGYSSAPLDQSVRGGTQTDGNLFARREQSIRALREAAQTAVAQYISDLPPLEAAHPLLSAPRSGSPRFRGAWSVRLTGAGGGAHANHIHAQGWLSSAIYISLPSQGDFFSGGELCIGSPPSELGLDLPPIIRIRPRVGHLILFPSYLWHGVSSFAAGERMTVAFDVAQPSGV